MAGGRVNEGNDEMDRISIKVILASVSHISRHYRLSRLYGVGILIINNYKLKWELNAKAKLFFGRGGKRWERAWEGEGRRLLRDE